MGHLLFKNFGFVYFVGFRLFILSYPQFEVGFRSAQIVNFSACIVVRFIMREAEYGNLVEMQNEECDDKL